MSDIERLIEGQKVWFDKLIRTECPAAAACDFLGLEIEYVPDPDNPRRYLSGISLFCYGTCPMDNDARLSVMIDQALELAAEEACVIVLENRDC